MKHILSSLMILLAVQLIHAQSVGIGTTAPNSKAILDISSTTKGLLIPSMTTAQRTAIASPPNGLMVYDTDKNEFYQYNGTSWKAILNGDYWSRPITSRDRITNATDSVGIGLSSPLERLDVNGNIRSRNNLLVDNNITTAGNLLVTGSMGIGTVSPASKLHILGGGIQIEDETIGKFGANALEFSGHIIPLVDNNRSLGISNKRFTVVWAVDGMINTSDARDKTKIAGINYGLSEIMKLRPVSFQWKNRPQSGTKLGLIAQEVETVLPEVVANPNRNPALLTENKDSAAVRIGMYYSDLIPVLIKAIQEQEEKIKKLEEEVASMKGTPGQAKKL